MRAAQPTPMASAVCPWDGFAGDQPGRVGHLRRNRDGRSGVFQIISDLGALFQKSTTCRHRQGDEAISRTGVAAPGYFRMLIAREITSAPTPSDTQASMIMSSLAHRLTAETSVGLNAVAVQKARVR
jgi:hypothetical protein